MMSKKQHLTAKKINFSSCKILKFTLLAVVIKMKKQLMIKRVIENVRGRIDQSVLAA